MITLLLLACSENGFSQLTQEDIFQQSRVQTVDVLLVVDNSCSMIEEQRKLATNFESFIQYFDEADVDWQVGVVTTDVEDEAQRGHLIGGDDEIVLSNAAGAEVDAVSYDRDWTVEPGVALALDPNRMSVTSNDSAGAWCSTTTPTPGAANGTCHDDTVPVRGSVLITEFLPDPDGVSDDVGEWVEITNVTEAAVDLAGWTLSDEGRNLWTFPEGASIGPSESVVIARSADVNEADFVTGTDFTLNNADLFLTAQTEGASEIFAEMVAQGTSGSGIEQGLEAARLALAEPMLSGDNAGFVRDEANLSILVISDEQDSSPLPVAQYLRAYADVKGEDAYRDHRRMNVSGVVGDTPPEFDGEPSCESSNGAAAWGSRYVDAVAQTQGLLDSICEEDFSPIVNELGLTLSGLEAEFTLSRVPELDTLEVSIYADASDDSKLRDLVRDVDYAYVEESNTIRFEYEQVPESEQYILVEYRVRSGG